MAASGTTASGLPDGSAAAAGTPFQLEVSTLAGGCLAAIPDAQGSWQLGDILGRLPEVLPGHRYQLLKGEAVLAAGTAIGGWAQPVDGRACVTAVVEVVPRTPEEQRQLDMALIRAASELNVEKVRQLLMLGADTSLRSRATWIQNALHKAVESRGPRRAGDGQDEERDGEEEGRLEAVVASLLSARADVNEGERGADGCCSNTLHAAIKRGSLKAVRMLLDAGASIDAVYIGPECQHTALHLATQVGSLPLTALLLQRAADVNATRSCLEQEPGVTARLQLVEVCETALHIAVAGGHEALVALLVQAGADTSIARCCQDNYPYYTDDRSETSLEELCAGKPGMLDALRLDSSATLFAGGDFGAEVEAALAAFAARRATL